MRQLLLNDRERLLLSESMHHSVGAAEAVFRAGDAEWGSLRFQE